MSLAVTAVAAVAAGCSPVVAVTAGQVGQG